MKNLTKHLLLLIRTFPSRHSLVISSFWGRTKRGLQNLQSGKEMLDSASMTGKKARMTESAKLVIISLLTLLSFAFVTEKAMATSHWLCTTTHYSSSDKNSSYQNCLQNKNKTTATSACSSVNLERDYCTEISKNDSFRLECEACPSSCSLSAPTTASCVTSAPTPTRTPTPTPTKTPTPIQSSLEKCYQACDYEAQSFELYNPNCYNDCDALYLGAKQGEQCSPGRASCSTGLTCSNINLSTGYGTCATPPTPTPASISCSNIGNGSECIKKSGCTWIPDDLIPSLGSCIPSSAPTPTPARTSTQSSLDSCHRNCDLINPGNQDCIETCNAQFGPTPTPTPKLFWRQIDTCAIPTPTATPPKTCNEIHTEQECNQSNLSCKALKSGDKFSLCIPILTPTPSKAPTPTPIPIPCNELNKDACGGKRSDCKWQSDSLGCLSVSSPPTPTPTLTPTPTSTPTSAPLAIAPTATPTPTLPPTSVPTCWKEQQCGGRYALWINDSTCDGQCGEVCDLGSACHSQACCTPPPASPSTPTPTRTPTPTPTPIGAPTSTPTPTLPPGVTPTATPTPVCPLPKAQGNANADCAINILDYNIWRAEFQAKKGTGSPADFNGNNKVDILDFNIWKTEFKKSLL